MPPVAFSRVALVGPLEPPVPALPWPTVVWPHSDDFLLADEPEADAYVVAMQQDGVGCVDLVRLLRRRGQMPIVVMGAVLAEQAAACLAQGADAVLPAASTLAWLVEQLQALARRSGAAVAPAWQLHAGSRTLRTPQGRGIALSEGELSLLVAFATAGGEPLRRDALVQALWADSAADGAGRAAALHAAIYRLRKRLEDPDAGISPLQAAGRAGYVFREPLQLSAELALTARSRPGVR